MRRVLVAVALLAVAVPIAQAKQSEPSLKSLYKSSYQKVKTKFGPRAPGRNILEDGVIAHHREPTKLGVTVRREHIRPATRQELEQSVATMRSMLSPPVASEASAPPLRASNYSPAPTATPQTGSGNYSIPTAIVMCESHGNYGAVNPSSGARGAYQLMPSTYSAYGGDGSWSKADQDRVAAKVWNGGAGRGQWSC